MSLKSDGTVVAVGMSGYYDSYKENTIKTHLLIIEIIKGVQAGEDIYSLFLKAVEALGLCTGDTVMYEVCRKNLEKNRVNQIQGY